MAYFRDNGNKMKRLDSCRYFANNDKSQLFLPQVRPKHTSKAKAFRCQEENMKQCCALILLLLTATLTCKSLEWKPSTIAAIIPGCTEKQTILSYSLSDLQPMNNQWTDVVVSVIDIVGNVSVNRVHGSDSKYASHLIGTLSQGNNELSLLPALNKTVEAELVLLFCAISPIPEDSVKVTVKYTGYDIMYDIINY
jgi:hypothetical protein